MIIAQAPAGSAIHRAAGDGWTQAEHLLAAAVDYLAVANWQRQGKKSAPKPEPVKRPGARRGERRYGRGAIPASTFDDWWNSHNHAEEVAGG